MCSRIQVPDDTKTVACVDLKVMGKGIPGAREAHKNGFRPLKDKIDWKKYPRRKKSFSAGRCI